MADLLGDYDSLELKLPRWRNRVDVYMNPESRSGFLASVSLNELGVIKNWQRRLRYNYTVLRVKGVNS